MQPQDPRYVQQPPPWIQPPPPPQSSGGGNTALLVIILVLLAVNTFLVFELWQAMHRVSTLGGLLG